MLRMATTKISQAEAAVVLIVVATTTVIIIGMAITATIITTIIAIEETIGIEIIQMPVVFGPTTVPTTTGTIIKVKGAGVKIKTTTKILTKDAVATPARRNTTTTIKTNDGMISRDSSTIITNNSIKEASNSANKMMVNRHIKAALNGVSLIKMMRLTMELQIVLITINQIMGKAIRMIREKSVIKCLVRGQPIQL